MPVAGGSRAPPLRARAAHWAQAAELERRTVGLALALAAIWIALDVATGGLFLTPRNLYNLAVQSSVVGVMATGMVLVIVARHIDLSVGSVLGFTGMTIAVLQVQADLWWPASVAIGLALGAAAGAWQGWWIAYVGVPAFVVTLGGLLTFRGAAYLLTEGRTVAPLDAAFQRLGGGVAGSIGATWSWALGLAAIAVIVALIARARAQRRAHAIPARPLGVDLALGAVWSAAVFAFVAVTNATPHPRTGSARGIPVPVLALIGCALAMHALGRATRFGRYVFAMGGSPEAAQLAGIDTRRVTVWVFVAMGALAAVGGTLTAARLGAGTSSLGTLAELNVIAAAVIGGTSLSGGSGSVGGALLGAVIMQSLDNGMVLLGMSSALRQVAIGLILIAAVAIDTGVARRRARAAG